MHIKECYISHNGITCFTNINTLVAIKEIDVDSKINTLNTIFNKNSILFYIGLRCCEFLIKDFIKNKNYLIEQNDILACIMFS
jgi:hypothetical protein